MVVSPQVMIFIGFGTLTSPLAASASKDANSPSNSSLD